MNPEFEFPPRIDRSKIPQEEHDLVSGLEECLFNMRLAVGDFLAALTLFDQIIHSATPDLRGVPDHVQSAIRKWCFVPCRDGAMTLWHFGKAVENSVVNINRSLALRGLVDHEARKAAARIFTTAFPGLDDVRNAVAHAAELTKSKADLDKNRVKGPITLDGGIHLENSSMQNMLIGRRYSNSIDGKLVTYEISTSSYEALNAAKEAYFKVFVPLAVR